MEPPPVRYATTSDGKRLAYTVSGSGRPLVAVPNTFMHARWAWSQYPELFEGLSQRFRFVHYNYRGQGMSTRGLAPDHSMADWQRDLETVMDAAAVRSAVLLGFGHGGHIAVRYALNHPERVDALILNAPTIAMSAWPESLMRGVSAQNWEIYVRTLIPHSVTPERYKFLHQAYHETQTQAEFQIAIREIFSWNLENELPDLKKPTLVLHPRNLVALPIEESQRFAAAVTGSRFVILDSATGLLGDAAEALQSVDDFVASLPDGEDVQARVPSPPLDGLTPREAEVLRLIAQGRSNQQIADDLVLSVRTVERHITNLYAKIGSHGKAEATAYALRNSLA